MAVNGQANMVEMETFLPKDGSSMANKETKYKIQMSPAKTKDLEASERLNADGRYYDPFKDRKVEHPTSDCDTLTHLLKASLGTGILAMPVAFKNAGLVVGIFCTILVAFVCTHCCYIVVKCAHVLYYRTRINSMTFADVGEAAFANGPPWGRKFSKLARISIQLGLFAAYFTTCSVYTVIIAHNLRQVIAYHMGYDCEEDVSDRLIIASLLVPLILLSWVPNLKALAPVSMVANLFMGLGLGATIYYLVQDLPSPSEVPKTAPLMNLPVFFSICIFAMEAIGVVMPLENVMKTPTHFIGLCGVLNQGMGGVTLIYILLGFLGYVKYGDGVKDSITLNLPKEDLLAQSVKVLVAMAVFCTYGLQYFVCLEIVWDSVKDKYSKNKRFAEYVVRTVLTAATVLVAVAVPTIGPFTGLIGALCFSILGLIIPIFIEIVTYWDVGFGRCNWVIIKNIFLLIFGLLALGFGTYTSCLEIVALYGPQKPKCNVTDPSVDPLSMLKTVANSLNLTSESVSTLSAPLIKNVTEGIANLTGINLPIPATT